MAESLSYVHRFEPGAGARALLLLHGTGGDENDLVPLGRTVAPDAALLSPRGKVLENGMPRFFRRFAEGELDEDDVRRRAEELADFVVDARARYGISAPVALGYSNGANIAAAILLLRPEVLAGAILLRAALPLRQPPPVDLTGKPILIISGATDRMISAEGAARLASFLRDAGANVEHHTLPVGHGLSQAGLTLAKQWWEAQARSAPAKRGRRTTPTGPARSGRPDDKLRAVEGASKTDAQHVVRKNGVSYR